MNEAWYTEVPDELARCLTDASACADACESLLETAAGLSDPDLRRRLVEAVILPAAVSRVILDLVDRKSHVLAAATVCRDTAGVAIERLELEVLRGEMLGALPALALDVAVEALRACVASCDQLLGA
jgi:hypothetical protein